MYTPIYSMLFKTHRDSELRNGGLYPCFCPARYGEGERGGEYRAPRISGKLWIEDLWLAGRGSRVRELRRLYATDENVSNE